MILAQKVFGGVELRYAGGESEHPSWAASIGEAYKILARKTGYSASHLKNMELRWF